MKTAALLLLTLLPVPLAAQGLGDAAAKEQKKREQSKAPAKKVFTDSDLSRVPPSGDNSGSADTPPRVPSSGQGDEGVSEPSSPSKLEASSDPLEKERQERKLLEAEWRVRFANAREQVATAEAACWQDVVRTQFYQGVPVQMKVKEFVESDEYRQAKKALVDLQEEFRRTGLPPGWAREQ